MECSKTGNLGHWKRREFRHRWNNYSAIAMTNVVSIMFHIPTAYYFVWWWKALNAWCLCFVSFSFVCCLFPLILWVFIVSASVKRTTSYWSTRNKRLICINSFHSSNCSNCDSNFHVATKVLICIESKWNSLLGINQDRSLMTLQSVSVPTNISIVQIFATSSVVGNKIFKS